MDQIQVQLKNKLCQCTHFKTNVINEKKINKYVNELATGMLLKVLNCVLLPFSFFRCLFCVGFLNTSH